MTFAKGNQMNFDPPEAVRPLLDQIYDGPDEVHKLSVSKRILARYA